MNYSYIHLDRNSRKKTLYRYLLQRGPDAGIYETLKAFKRNRDKCEFPMLHVPFGTRGTRSSKIWFDTKKTPGTSIEKD